MPSRPVANLVPIPVGNLLLVSMTPVEYCHRCQRHPAANLPPWQIKGTISDCWHLPVNWKEKIICVFTLLPKGVKKTIKPFLIEDFFHFLPESMTPVMPLELQISPRIFKKCEIALMIYSGAWRKLIHVKKT